MNRLNISIFTSGLFKGRNRCKETASWWSSSGRKVRENQTKGVREAVIERWRLGRRAVAEWQRGSSRVAGCCLCQTETRCWLYFCLSLRSTFFICLYTVLLWDNNQKMKYLPTHRFWFSRALFYFGWRKQWQLKCHCNPLLEAFKNVLMVLCGAFDF